MTLTRRHLLGTAALAGLALPAHADETPSKGGTLTAVMYPEPPYTNSHLP